MPADAFTPEIWSRRLNTKLRGALVFGSVVNTDYEGEISALGGDTVKINQVGEVTVAAYVPGTTSLTVQQLTDYQTTLKIDQIYSFDFGSDKVNIAQANTNYMDEAFQSAAWGLKNVADEYIAGLYGEAGSTSSLAVDSTNVLAGVLTCSQELSKNNVPREGRWLIGPPEFTTKLAIAKVLVTDAGAAADAFMNGFQGRVGGFDYYESNNVANDGTNYQILAGSRKAISFVGQINYVERFRPEASFTDAIKGLYVFGAKVVYPDALTCLNATFGAEP
jgi:hypothetical protein